MIDVKKHRVVNINMAGVDPSRILLQSGKGKKSLQDLIELTKIKTKGEFVIAQRVQDFKSASAETRLKIGELRENQSWTVSTDCTTYACTSYGYFCSILLLDKT